MYLKGVHPALAPSALLSAIGHLMSVTTELSLESTSSWLMVWKSWFTGCLHHLNSRKRLNCSISSCITKWRDYLLISMSHFKFIKCFTKSGTMIENDSASLFLTLHCVNAMFSFGNLPSSCNTVHWPCSHWVLWRGLSGHGVTRFTVIVYRRRY